MTTAIDPAVIRRFLVALGGRAHPTGVYMKHGRYGYEVCIVPRLSDLDWIAEVLQIPAAILGIRLGICASVANLEKRGTPPGTAADRKQAERELELLAMAGINPKSWDDAR